MLFNSRNSRTHAVRTLSLCLLSGAFSLTGIMFVSLPASAEPVPSMTVVSVEPDYNSAKINFSPVTGAQDYRVYDVTNPNIVKYAGQWHVSAGYGQVFVTDNNGNITYPLTPTPSDSSTPYTTFTIPATQIEWNGITPGTQETLVVQALGTLGPAAAGNLPNSNNEPLISGSQDGMSMLGSNAGESIDGNISINGQGSYQNLVNVIAQSAPFTVASTGKPVLPSLDTATQVFFDPLEKGTFTKHPKVDSINGIESWQLQAAENWTVETFGVDTNNTQPFIMDKHFMDVLFDGNTLNTNQPLHNNHAALTLSPASTADFSNGQILHMTMEVDAHVDGRRWLAFNIAPANDPFTGFYTVNSKVNNTDTGVFVQIEANDIVVSELEGPARASEQNSPPDEVELAGAAGQAPLVDSRPTQLPDGIGFQVGRGLDNRSRFDLFMSESHYACYEEGINVAEGNFQHALPFRQAKCYFTHYLYHTANEVNDLAMYAPYELFWRSTFPYSDERHWGNMGMEVLPASTPWASLAALCTPAAPQQVN